MQITQFPVGDIGANCYLIASGGELVIIDPGGPARMTDIIRSGGEEEKIPGEIKKSGAALKFIILTHYHFDHVSGAEDLKKALGGEILFHKLEKKFTGVRADRFISEGDEISLGRDILKIIHTPGHTKGSICLLGDNIFFSGDTLFENGYGRTDYPGGSESAMVQSLKRISKILKAGVKIYPGHGNAFKI